MTEYKELERLAREAQKLERYEREAWYSEDELFDDEETSKCVIGYPKNARFIAAASPDAVLSLIERIEALTKEVEATKNALQDKSYDYDGQVIQRNQAREERDALQARINAAEKQNPSGWQAAGSYEHQAFKEWSSAESFLQRP